MNTIRKLRLERNLKQSDLAQILNVKQNTISNWETERTEVDRESTLKLADFFGVTVDYLLGREKPTISNTEKVVEFPKPKIQDEVELNDIYPIPLLGRVVAGVPIEAQEDIEGYVYISYRPSEEYFSVRVHGDSMINAGIFDGSILIVHKQEEAVSGDIVVAMLNGEQTVKRFKVYGESVFLMPENPAYDMIPVPPGSNFVILGKVVEVRMTLK